MNWEAERAKVTEVASEDREAAGLGCGGNIGVCHIGDIAPRPCEVEEPACDTGGVAVEGENTARVYRNAVFEPGGEAVSTGDVAFAPKFGDA